MTPMTRTLLHRLAPEPSWFLRILGLYCVQKFIFSMARVASAKVGAQLDKSLCVNLQYGVISREAYPIEVTVCNK